MTVQDLEKESKTLLAKRAKVRTQIPRHHQWCQNNTDDEYVPLALRQIDRHLATLTKGLGDGNVTRFNDDLEAALLDAAEFKKLKTHMGEQWYAKVKATIDAYKKPMSSIEDEMTRIQRHIEPQGPSGKKARKS